MRRRQIWREYLAGWHNSAVAYLGIEAPYLRVWNNLESGGSTCAAIKASMAI